jgi:hypothetical protein
MTKFSTINTEMTSKNRSNMDLEKVNIKKHDNNIKIPAIYK